MEVEYFAQFKEGVWENLTICKHYIKRGGEGGSFGVRLR
jgi:hypothetical protein